MHQIAGGNKAAGTARFNDDIDLHPRYGGFQLGEPFIQFAWFNRLQSVIDQVEVEDILVAMIHQVEGQRLARLELRTCPFGDGGLQ